jgi:ornithine cyclodeaminase/alanine dehydrogenase-like protein (mu-crystallin family)
VAAARPGSLLATQLMLIDTPTELVAIGAGTQIAAHVSLFLTLYPTIRKCTIFNRTLNDRLTDLVQVLQSTHGDVDIRGFPLSTTSQSSEGEHKEEHPGLQRALKDASIVVTATSSTIALFPSCYVSPGTHLCLIGSYTPEM